MPVKSQKRGYSSHGQESKKLQVRVSIALAAQIDEFARVNGVSRSSALIHLIEKGLTCKD